MGSLISPPDPRALLPPLLACLPTAIATTNPPPALLPLLSPVLRQRVQLLSTSSPSDASSWLPLLCWNPDKAAQVPGKVENNEALQPHPVSGEIEIDDAEIESLRYRRLDEETMQAQINLKEVGLNVIWLWCMGDKEGGGNGWRVAEVHVLEDGEEQGWSTSLKDAEEKVTGSAFVHVVATGQGIPKVKMEEVNDDDDDDEDDDSAYWAQYDNTPGRTPAPKRSPPPPSMLAHHGQSTAEERHYAQYSSVQPDMDNDDPSEERMAPGESSLHGEEFMKAVHNNSQSGPGLEPYITGEPPQEEIIMLPGYSSSYQTKDISPELMQPSPSTPSSSDLNAVPILEENAAAQERLEIGVKQHLSTSIKSLYRLAKSTGIERVEFERLVKTELDILSILDSDD
ncbi:MAG: hypothetical protein M1827_006935 [Pycnora praestabilis]|nr:MAG: hypothetical protein M1827_006935 [Pycnora praestabilis]